MWGACKSVLHGALEHAAVCIDMHLPIYLLTIPLTYILYVCTYLQESFKKFLSISISLFGLVNVKVQHTQWLNLVGSALYILSVEETSTSDSEVAAQRNYVHKYTVE